MFPKRFPAPPVQLPALAASDIGFGIGHWPMTFHMAGTIFVRLTAVHQGDDLVAMDYRDSRTGDIQRIYND